MRPLQRWVFLLCVLSFFAGLAQAQDTLVFPSIDPASVSFIDVSMEIDHLAISNDASYLYMCDEGSIKTCLLRNKAGDIFLNFSPKNNQRAFWSYDNKVIAISTPLSCQDGNLFVLYTEKNITEQQCTYLFPALENWWSPINLNELYMTMNSMYDWKIDDTFFIHPLSAPPMTLLQQSIGYLDVLWDAETSLPLGFMRPQRIFKQSYIERAYLSVCYHAWDMGDNNICVHLLNTLDYSEAYVLGAQANGHWVLWYGHLGNNPREIVKSSDQIADTIFYMTYLPTGETQEVFRLSQLGQAHIELTTVAWSPDAHTLALSVQPMRFALEIAPNTTPLVGDKPGVLVLDVDWSDNQP